jgi:hypothetical protein
VVDPDALDQQEMELYERNPPLGAVREVLGGRMPADLACDLVRSTLPYMAQREADAIAAALRAPAPEAGEVDFDDADGFDDEDDFDEELAEAAPAVGAGAARGADRGAPSTNGDPGADECRRTTKAPPHGGNGRAKPHGNGRAKRRGS